MSNKLKLDSAPEVTVDAEIGAVEIKNATDDTRATVTARGLQVEAAGGVASGATDSGNPVKVAGRYNATKPTLTDGQRGDIQLGTRGAVSVQVLGVDGINGANVPPAATDAFANSSTTALAVQNFGLLFNGTTWDRVRSNQDNITVLASAAQTTTQTQADQTNYNAKGVTVVLDVTSAGTGSITLEIDGKDPVSGKYYALLTGAAVVANSTNVYTVYPGITAAANVSASAILPRTWRVKVTANNANSVTYSVGAMLNV